MQIRAGETNPYLFNCLNRPLIVHDAHKVPCAIFLNEHQAQAFPIHPPILLLKAAEVIFHIGAVGIEILDVVDSVPLADARIHRHILRVGEIR